MRSLRSDLLTADDDVNANGNAGTVQGVTAKQLGQMFILQNRLFGRLSTQNFH